MNCREQQADCNEGVADANACSSANDSFAQCVSNLYNDPYEGGDGGNNFEMILAICVIAAQEQYSGEHQAAYQQDQAMWGVAIAVESQLADAYSAEEGACQNSCIASFPSN
jgi:hypothetical protein